jgi:hypothetical protein
VTPDPNRPYDPDLPILAELERTVHARALTRIGAAPERVSAAAQPRAAGPEGAAAPSRATVRRVLRRALLLAGVSGLVGASAFATHSLVSGDPDPSGDPSLRTTAAVEIASGRRAGEAWTLSAARRGRDLCDALIVAGTVATRCARPPGRGDLLLDGISSPRGRWVVALAGPDVASVMVRTGTTRRDVATRQLPAAAASRAAQLPTGLRWVVVALPRGRGEEAPVSAQPRDRRGRPLGPARGL